MFEGGETPGLAAGREGERFKGAAVLEVALVFLLFTPLGWWYGTTDLFRVETGLFGWSYLGASLQFIIPLAILFAARRRIADYGLTLRHWKSDLKRGLACYLFLLIPYGALAALNIIGGIGYRAPVAAFAAAAGYVAALLLALWAWRKEEARPSGPAGRTASARNDIIVLCFLLVLPVAAGFFLQAFSLKLVSTVVWQFFFSGFGEELLYRGYYQSRLNAGFGRPWQFMGTRFGIGLLVTAALFGLRHALNPFNPLAGAFQLDWGWGVMTFFSGLFFGFVREKTGGVLAPALAHGLPDAVGEAFSLMLAGR